MNRRTKIVATLGPASWEEAILRRLIQEGVDVIRLNFSHADHSHTAELIKLIRRLSEEEKRSVAILQDLQGPRIRTGVIAKPPGFVELVPGHEITLTTSPMVADTAEKISVDYVGLPLDVKPGDTLLIEDGLMELKVLATTTDTVRCVIITGGKLTSHKGINVPNVTLGVPTITDKDKADLRFGIENGVDYVALSFVRIADDILNLKKLIREYAGIDKDELDLPLVIAKIEKHEAITNFDSILEATDGIMVARGDLGVEMPTEQVPILQKELIQKCNLAGKPVITATQMLDSMIRNPRPTRAEASDVANAIIDGTDAVMLSGESANGIYPLEAVRVMIRIAITAEQIVYKQPYRDITLETASSVTDAISQAVCGVGREIKAAAIVTTTTSGFTARMISRNRPNIPIYAVTHNYQALRRLALIWGVQAYLCPRYETTDEMLQMAENIVKEQGTIKTGDIIVVTAGIPIGIVGHSNLLKVQVVS